MIEPLFDPEKCNVPEVPKLDFDFVSECSIATPPPPIFDCQPPLVPREPPPPPCPAFDASIALKSAIDRDECSIGSEPAAALVLTQTDTNPCRYAIDLDLSIPIPPVPCPTLNGGDVNVVSQYANCPGATSTFTITKEVIPGDCDTQDSCKFTVDLDLSVPVPLPPCPTIKTSGAIKATQGLVAPTLKFLSTQSTTLPPCGPPDCKFDIDLEIEIPEPVCPEITATGQIAQVPGLPAPQIVFDVTQIGEECAFDFNLDIVIPQPCVPAFTVESKIRCTPGADEPIMTFTLAETKNCKYDANLDITIPCLPPCPEISGDVYVYAAPAPTGKLLITHEPPLLKTEQCVYTLDLEIGVPLPCIPTFTVARKIACTPGADEPSMTFTLAREGSISCNYKADLDILIPCLPPCPAIDGDVYVYGAPEPTGKLVVTHVPPALRTEQCEYWLDFEIGVPTACLPTFVVTKDIKCTPGTDVPSMTFTIARDGATGCQYKADLNILIPCLPPCPAITGAIEVYKASNYTGSFTVTHTPPAVKTEQCQYWLDLKVGVPERTGYKLEKGTVTCAYTANCEAAPFLDVTIDPPDVNGIQKLNIDLRLPTPRVYKGGTITLGDYGSGAITVDNTDPCQPAIKGNITLSTTTCPTGAGGGGGGTIVAPQ